MAGVVAVVVATAGVVVGEVAEETAGFDFLGVDAGCMLLLVRPAMGAMFLRGAIRASVRNIVAFYRNSWK